MECVLGLGLQIVATGLDFELGALGHLRICITGMLRAKGSKEDWMG